MPIMPATGDPLKQAGKNSFRGMSIRGAFIRRPSCKRPDRAAKQETEMKVMVMVKATDASEAGAMPSQELLEAMGKFNEELVNAGVMLAGEGLHPSSRGARVAFDGPQRRVIDGPFTETRELVAGFWLWQVRSLEEAIEWVKRCPNPMPGPSEIEIRPIFDAVDFGDEFTPELREQEDRLRQRLGN
jgi:hypothetical protein